MHKKQHILFILIALLGATIFTNYNAEISSESGKTATLAPSLSPSRSITTTETNTRITTVAPEESTTTERPTATSTSTPETETTTEPPRATESGTATTETSRETEEVLVIESTPPPAEPTPEPETAPAPEPEPTPVVEPTPTPEPEPTPTPAATSTPEPESASTPSAPAPAPVTTTTQTYTPPTPRPVPAPQLPIVTPEPVPEPEPESEIQANWEAIAAIPNGTADDDEDGLSNNIEFLEKTDPNNPDTDGDQLTDSEEVIDFKTDPLDPNSPSRMTDLGIRITSFEEGQIVADSEPFIKGVAPISSYIQISATNEQEETTILGQTQTHENSIFTFISPPLEDGTYILNVEQIEEPAIIDELFIPAHAQDEDDKPNLISEPITIVIDSTNDVTSPTPKLLDDQEITPEVLMENLRVEIENDQPVLRGNTVFQHKVIATWQSVVFSSALIADSSAGEFEIKPHQQLAEGNHEVEVQAIHPNTGAVSEKVRIPFVVVHAEEVDLTTKEAVTENVATPEIRPAAEEEQPFIQSAVLNWMIANPIPTALVLVIILFLIYKVAQTEQDSLDPDL